MPKHIFKRLKSHFFNKKINTKVSEKQKKMLRRQFQRSVLRRLSGSGSGSGSGIVAGGSGSGSDYYTGPYYTQPSISEDPAWTNPQTELYKGHYNPDHSKPFTPDTEITDEWSPDQKDTTLSSNSAVLALLGALAGMAGTYFLINALGGGEKRPKTDGRRKIESKLAKN
eukprot:TRINITY_DN2964_c0_g5_i1.p1 TRINITY_DN2964_c0_g5~~TRINITY_DN2964_c0_g5_i1.p1  ORF type:complete len:169 (+),score=20.51 TRINITY_DN2964_c0_g5_i1:523-1029(+)